MQTWQKVCYHDAIEYIHILHKKQLAYLDFQLTIFRGDYRSINLNR